VTDQSTRHRFATSSTWELVHLRHAAIQSSALRLTGERIADEVQAGLLLVCGVRQKLRTIVQISSVGGEVRPDIVNIVVAAGAPRARQRVVPFSEHLSWIFVSLHTLKSTHCRYYLSLKCYTLCHRKNTLFILVIGLNQSDVRHPTSKIPGKHLGYPRKFDTNTLYTAHHTSFYMFVLDLLKAGNDFTTYGTASNTI